MLCEVQLLACSRNLGSIYSIGSIVPYFFFFSTRIMYVPHLLHGDAGRPEEDVAPPVSAHLAAPPVHQERHEDEHKLQREDTCNTSLHRIISDK